jgi:hypothetical protein
MTRPGTFAKIDKPIYHTTLDRFHLFVNDELTGLIESVTSSRDGIGVDFVVGYLQNNKPKASKDKQKTATWRKLR